jgi:hypothetical protein
MRLAIVLSCSLALTACATRPYYTGVYRHNPHMWSYDAEAAQQRWIDAQTYRPRRSYDDSPSVPTLLHCDPPLMRGGLIECHVH